MRKVDYQIKKESFDDQKKAGRWNPELEITFRDKTGQHTHKLSAGHQDDIHVYRIGDETFVGTRNEYLGYVRLEVFKGQKKMADLFLEDHDAKEIFGKLDLAPTTTIKRLMPYT